MHLTQETLWTQEERLAQLDSMSLLPRRVVKCPDDDSVADVTVESLQAYIAVLLERMHIETLVHGNLLKDVRPPFHSVWEPLLIMRRFTGSHQSLQDC